MSRNANNENIISVEIIETKPTKIQHTPSDPTCNTMYYHKNVAPGECELCGSCSVTRALYNQKESAKCKLVKHYKGMAKLEYDELNTCSNHSTVANYNLIIITYT
jgi:hypothetical protein